MPAEREQENSQPGQDISYAHRQAAYDAVRRSFQHGVPDGRGRQIGRVAAGLQKFSRLIQSDVPVDADAEDREVDPAGRPDFRFDTPALRELVRRLTIKPDISVGGNPKRLRHVLAQETFTSVGIVQREPQPFVEFHD